MGVEYQLALPGNMAAWAEPDQRRYVGPPPEKLDSRGNVLFNNTLVIDGSVVGTWRRTVKKGEVHLEVTTFAPIPKTASRYVTEAADRYGAFLGLTPRLRIT